MSIDIDRLHDVIQGARSGRRAGRTWAMLVEAAQLADFHTDNGGIMHCTRCDGYGFLNIEQVPDEEHANMEATGDYHAAVQKWIADNDEHDVGVCDCCGDGDGWHGEPGQHDEADYGLRGPYAYNGGLPECA